MRVGSLFSGIGGIDLGLERAGMEISWQVEIDPFCRKVLEKHWPKVRRFRDVREVGKHNLEAVDLVAGGFPCQPFSISGKRKGREDDRYLWPEMFRIIRDLRPAWAIIENVFGIIEMGVLDQIQDDLENENYSSQAFVVPACAVGAPHERKRVWVVANANGIGSIRCLSGIQEQVRVPKAQDGIVPPEWWRQNSLPSPLVCRGNDGVPKRLDRLKSLGNSVVPQIVYEIGRMILEVNC